MRYLVVFQRLGVNSFSAFVPDVPTCAATGNSEEEIRARIRDALFISTHTTPTPPFPSAFVEEMDSNEASGEVRELLD